MNTPESRPFTDSETVKVVSVTRDCSPDRVQPADNIAINAGKRRGKKYFMVIRGSGNVVKVPTSGETIPIPLLNFDRYVGLLVSTTEFTGLKKGF